MSYDASRQYAAHALEARVTGADPHGLVAMLIEGAIDRLALARSHMQHGNVAGKGTQIGAAMSIIGGLRASLDLERGGEIAQNLDRLYEYMEERVLQGNMHDDEKALAEVGSLLGVIKSGWDAIPPEFRQRQP